MEQNDRTVGSVQLLGRQDAGANTYLIVVGGVNAFTVEFGMDAGASCLDVTWSRPGELESNLHALLLGPVLRIVLALRGVLCLHAGAVSVGGRALVIAGPSGAGKSSALVALARAGHPILADDLVVLEEDAGAFQVHPGHPQMRLWPHTLAALDERWEALPRVLSIGEKRQVNLAIDPATAGSDWRFDPRPTPLAAIYVMAGYDGGLDAPVVRRLAPAKALLFLLEHGRGVPPTALLPQQGEIFRGLGRLARSVPVYEVFRPPGLELLPHLVEALVADRETLGVAR